ncbi:hypothetical protein I8751_07950 [Nostocaceae cyanobacterium CENA357]|uniref:Uncharacterized protein n=1 Tax=Atlanticothrix silvestris CENA357 TaxID=1725252 RepID=A0A8J7HGR4_9CYAN|nr:hypothetical protein [Atlanticothrix silvestris]MBH8552306.1 hypothetical protein [Atlanticothrix silvestris CENA357]
MVKKQSLSDLIQEEAQKLTPTEDESTIEVQAEKVVEENTLAADTSSTETPEPTSARRTNPTKADLEVIIKELKETLEQSQKKEKTFQKKLADLQAALSEQQASAERLTKELNETKKTALQLAEANSKLIEENKVAKQEQEIEHKALVKEQEKSSAIQVKEKYNPIAYRKSHLATQKMPQQPIDTNDDFADNTWLYD